MSLNPETKNQATWWTAPGFALKPAPNAFASIPNDWNDWEQSLRDAGYELYTTWGGEFDPLSITIWGWKAENHFYVEMCDVNRELSRFFVDGSDHDAFFATWYPGFIHDATIASEKEIFLSIQKILTAFVRHGHGKDSIDEEGHMSLDDRIYFAQQRRERQEAKRKPV